MAHESLSTIAKKAPLLEIFVVWLVLLAAALAFFIFVFRKAMRQTKRGIVQLIEDRLAPVSQQLGFAVQAVSDRSLLDEITKGQYVVKEALVMEIEESVRKSVWVVSPDFRYELADHDTQSYTRVIANNILKGVKYFYFVPQDGTTEALISRFEASLTNYFKKIEIAESVADSSLCKITIVSLPVGKYPATAIFGCALYEIDELNSVFVEYFPKESASWNLVVRNVVASRGGSVQNSLNPFATEVRGTILLKDRFKAMLVDAQQDEAKTGFKVNYLAAR